MLKPLSARELQVLKLIAVGKQNRAIAEMLAISIHAVEAHRGRVMMKLNLHSVVDLVKYALREGLIET